jgi:hypothetical protein
MTQQQFNEIVAIAAKLAKKTKNPAFYQWKEIQRLVQLARRAK